MEPSGRAQAIRVGRMVGGCVLASKTTASVCRQRRRSQPTSVGAIERIIGARACDSPPVEASRGAC